MNCWLMKSEPGCYSISDLKKDKRTNWDGVRNYQARNFMTQEMKVGDLVLFYHSNSKPSGVAGIAKVCKNAYPDFTALDPEEDHFDPRSTPENPIWQMVDIEFISEFKKIISLEEMHQNPKLNGMMVLQKGCRLSVMPVSKAHFDDVLKMA